MFGFVFNFCYYIIFLFVPYLVFVFFSDDENFHSSGGLLYWVKFIFGRKALKKTMTSAGIEDNENAEFVQDESTSKSFSVTSMDQKGNVLKMELTLFANYTAHYWIYLKINGKTYILPENKIVETDFHELTRKNIRNYDWKCGNLKIEILEPFKRFRLIFNGFLSNITQDNSSIEHVRFNLIWNTSSKPILSTENDLNFHASQLAKTKWKNGDWIKLLGEENGYLQFGALKGKISGDSFDETEVNLSCVKKRSFGIRKEIDVTEEFSIFLASENGNIFNFGVKNIRNGCENLKFGHILTNSGRVFPIKSSDLCMTKIHSQNISKKLTVHLKANGKTFKLIFSLRDDHVKFISNDLYGFKCENSTADVAVNSFSGVGFLSYWSSLKNKENRQPMRSVSILREIDVEKSPEIFLTRIGSEESKILKLTGGKGNSLALMKNLENLKIPDGFIVTTNAFRKQLESNFDLRKSILSIENIAYGRIDGNLEIACKNTVELFEKQEILPNVSQNIRDELEKFEKIENTPYIRWAVRSSAIGEDSEEFSSAGQNETYLGCHGDEEILQKIVKCWGSLYNFHSVMYRKNHGLPVVTEMAVVVQQMIPAEAAGVLFTNHPTTLNPGKMLITSNFGLGETVVSGESEPDSIILKRSDGVFFESYTAGSKKNCLVMDRNGVYKIINETSNNESSLSEELAIKLGKIGVFIEESFGSPRDIEWALYKNEFYILQSRPITTLYEWNDYELLHEFDHPHVSNDIFYTKGNIGEVLCYAVTPLTLTTVVNSIEKGYQTRMFGEYDPFVSKMIVCSHNHAMIELIAGLYAKPSKNVEMPSKMVDLAVFGHSVLNEEINRLAIERYGVLTFREKLKEISDVVKMLWNSNAILGNLIEETNDFRIEIEKNDDLIEIYEKINVGVEKFIKVSYVHCLISGVSVLYQTFVLLTLLEGGKDLTVEHYNDLALILSSCNDVVSAEIPTRLEEIAQILKTLELNRKFVEVNPGDGVEWLKENCIDAHLLLVDFLKVHGHRLLGECELSLKSWEMDPSEVIKMIQANCKIETSSKKKNHDGDIIGKLGTPKKKLTKFLLKFLIKKHRISVGNREKSKSAMIKAVNVIRIAYRTLAGKMVNTGLIPNENLIFFLTHHELFQVFNGKNQNLITKALRRRKLYPIWNKLKFPEISYGIPIPEEENSYELTNSEIFCEGTPVCTGEITSRACVVTSLDEIDQLREGDVLITESTDIGWSPYFPILTGLVTELGGLVSHGAVVAREYGLPCIVGAKNATKIFKTGDMVKVSGKTGKVEKLKI